MEKNSSIFDLKNIDLYGIIRDVLCNWWVILLAGCIGVMGAYTIIRESYEPVYTSSAVYVINPKESTGYKRTDKVIAQNAVKAFQGLLTQDIMKKRIMEDIGASEWNVEISATVLESTNIMTLRVTSPKPVESFLIIKYVMENYADLSRYLNEDAIFEELRAPEISTFPDNVLTPRNKSLMAGACMAFLMFCLIIFLSIMRRTIKTESAFSSRLDTILYGTIHHEKKNRTIKSKIRNHVKSILITSPVVSFRFVEAINNIRVKMEYEHERHSRKNVFMVTSACENEGKSTIAINLALSLVREGKSVIILDADLRKPAMFKLLDVPPEKVKDYIDLLQGVATLEEVMYKDEFTGIQLLMANKGHSSTYEFVKSSAMNELIDTISKMADYVIVDTPPMTMVSDAEAMADMVDFSMLIVRQDYGYEGDISNCIGILNNSNSKFLGCVFNDYKVITSINQKISYGRYGYGTEVQYEQ